jgi:hypothetical protein
MSENKRGIATDLKALDAHVIKPEGGRPRRITALANCSSVDSGASLRYA